MVAKRKITRVCDRCPANKPKPALKTVPLVVDGDKYTLDLCHDHAAELDRLLYGWARLGELVEEHGKFSPQYREDTRRVAALRAAQAEPHAPKPVKAIRVTGDALVGLPPDAGEWVFERHAYDRLMERNISAARALKAACDPEVIRPGNTPDTQVHIAAGVKAVVKEDTKVIVTVAKMKETA